MEEKKYTNEELKKEIDNIRQEIQETVIIINNLIQYILLLDDDIECEEIVTPEDYVAFLENWNNN